MNTPVLLLKIFALTAVFLSVLATPFSTAYANSQAVKVAWWNVGGANFISAGDDLVNALYDHSILGSQILELLKRESPDVLVLGEYYSGFIEAPIESKLAEFLPYQFYLGYSEKLEELGIKVYSKYPFVTNYLKNAAGKFEVPEFDSRTFPRRFQMISVKLPQCDVHLAPLHLLMPWEQMYKWNASYEIIWGKDNLLAKQLYLFENYLEKNEEKNGSRTLFFGDFNLPSVFLGLSSSLFDETAAKYTYIQPAGLKYSYDPPNASGLISHLKRTMIDHSFWSGSSEKGRFSSAILDFKGSDHHPLVIKGSVQCDSK